MRRFVAVLGVLLGAAQPVAAEDKMFSVQGGSGSTAYAGTVRLTPALQDERGANFMKVEWRFGTYVMNGLGVFSKDEPQLLTVSFVSPYGLGVGRYRLGPDGNAVGTLVGERGIFAQETWTALGGPDAGTAPPSPPPAPPPAAGGGRDIHPSTQE